jgi:hypothetical protein
MNVIPKIFPLLLLALAISLSSCVNQVTSPQGLQVPLDTNYLHGFSKIKISFSAIGQYHYVFDYYGHDTSRQDSIIPTNHIPQIGDTTLQISWDGRNFHVLKDTGYSYSDTGNGYNGSIEKYHYFQEIKGSISDQNKILDTLSNVFNDYVYRNELHTREDLHDSESVVLRSLPLSIMNTDILTFSFEGKSLKDKIISIKHNILVFDASGFVFSSDFLQSVSWDVGKPIITITFYK